MCVIEKKGPKLLTLTITSYVPEFSLILDLLVIREQSVTQGSMGREAPRYPPRGPGL